MQGSNELRNIVATIVKVMAWDRHTYLNHISWSLKGPLRHHYYVVLAEKNKKGNESTTHCWRNEIEDLLLVFDTVLRTKVYGFNDYARVIAQAISEVKGYDGTAQNKAKKKVESSFNISIKYGITQQDTDKFWDESVSPLVQSFLDSRKKK
jgi:hypothetical protein